MSARYDASISQNNIFILQNISGTMLFKYFGGASDFVLKYTELSQGVPVGILGFVECALCACALVRG